MRPRNTAWPSFHAENPLRACEVRRVREPRFAERGVRFSDVGEASASTLPCPRLGRRMLRLLELFLQASPRRSSQLRMCVAG